MEPTITIHSIAGEAIATAIVTQEAVIHEELMTSDYVKLSWSSATGETLPAGAYIDYGGERYSLLEPYTPQAESGGEYRYEPEFQSRVMAWGKQVLPLYTYEEDGKTVKTREMDWDFTGSPADAMYMVEQAIRNETGEEWQVELSDSLPATITISSQSGSILSALNEIASECETEWWADKATDTLYLSRCQRGKPVALTAGGNVGVPSVTEAKDGYYTRFYVFGSTRNVTQESGSAATNSVVNKRLTLDPATYPGGYIDAREGLLPGEIFTAILTYDDIYPSSKLEIGDVRARLKYRLDSSGEKIETGADDEGNPVYEQYAIWYFQLPGLDFDPDTIIPQKTLSVHFESGQLAGRDFELAYHEKASRVKDAADVAAFQVKAGDYEIIIDESEGTILPGLAYIIPQDGDKATLYNIKMPAEYTSAAQAELAERALKDIARRMADNRSYEMDSNPVAFKEDGTELSVGQSVNYAYLGVTLETRVLMVERHLDFPWQATIRVGNELIKGNTQQLKEEVTQASQNIDVLKAFNELSVSLSNSYANAMREMQEGFARIGNMWRVDPDRENTIYSSFNAYVKGWLSAKGANDTQGEGGGGGGLSYSRLDSWEGYSDEEKGGWVLSAYLGYRLYKDINDLKSGVAMSYAVQGTGNAITDVTRDSSRWVFTRGKTFSELWHTHTLSDISNLHSSWDAVLKAQKPNWLTDVSLSTISDLHANWDAILKVAPSAYVTRWPTAAEVGALTQATADSRYAMKTVTISAGAGLAGGGNLSANRTLSLAAVGTAGTYTKVTVDAYGRVTAHASLSAADIPTLAISKISGLQSSLDSKLPKATFDDLFEKVTLSDGTVAIHAKYGFYSDGFVSGKGANPSAGEGGGTAYNRLDTWEGYTDELATWVLSAGLGHSLYNDVQSLKRGAAVSFTIQGSGNAITDVTKSGTSLTFTKGLAFLTSHQNIYVLTIKGNGTAIDKYTPNSAAKTINITPANIGAATSGHTHSQYLTSVSLATISDLHSSWDSVLKAQKPAWLTAVSLATISDLNSGWDALLKAAPSAYVTRWPTAAEVGALTQSAADGRYVNVSGDTMTGDLGIPYKNSSIDCSAPVSGALPKVSDAAELRNYKSAIGSVQFGENWYALISVRHRNGAYDGVNYGMYIRTGLTFEGNLLWGKQYGSSAWQAERTLLDSSNYTSYAAAKSHSHTFASLTSKPTTLSGYGITDGVTAVSVTGSGNAVTAASISGHTLTLTKGLSALTSHQAIYALTLQGNGSTIATYNPKSAAATINLTPSTLKLYRGYMGPQTGRTQNLGNLYVYQMNGSTTGDRPATYMSAIGFGNGTGGTVEIAGGWVASMGLWYRALRDYEDNWYSWRKLLDSANYTDYTVNKTGSGASGTWGISISGNASSATKLATARTLWGQSFNGTSNVSGSLSSVVDISMTGKISSSKATNTYLAGNQGQALVNSTASAGAYVMLYRGCSTNGYFTHGTYQGTYLLQYTAKSTVTAGTNNVTKSATLLDESGNATFPGTINAVLFHSTTGVYSDGYVSAKGQNTSSDLRLKDVLGSVTLPLERIAKAPIFRFSWKDGSGESAGSSAQYWRSALPAAVRERDGYLEMQYGNIALISAVAIARETLRLASRVSDHERRIRELEAENRRLRETLAMTA